MRYRPIGFGSGDPGAIGSSDSDDPTQPRQQFRPPPALNGHSTSKKRKEREDEVTDADGNKAHKTKKKKHKETRLEEQTTARSQVLANSNSQSNGILKKLTDVESKASSKANGISRDETKDIERLKRKEEKKRKKKREKEKRKEKKKEEV